MDLGLDDKRALVAGASKGLGRAVADALAAEGCAVAMCARTADDIERAAAEVERAYPEVRAVPIAADLSTDDGPAEVVRRASEALGGIDILVANSGGPPPGPFEAHDRDAFRAALRGNFESTVELSRAVLPGMRQRRWGRIVAITSIAAKQPVDGLILSNAARAAVAGFVRTLASEVAPHGITVNNAMPGYTRTERVTQLARSLAERDGTTPDDVIRGWTERIPAARIGEPAEFAALFAFLCSDRAGYITGSSIPVDGGWIRALV